jgi:hypothetical protein
MPWRPLPLAACRASGKEHHFPREAQKIIIQRALA